MPAPDPWADGAVAVEARRREASALDQLEARWGRAPAFAIDELADRCRGVDPIAELDRRVRR